MDDSMLDLATAPKNHSYSNPFAEPARGVVKDPSWKTGGAHGPTASNPQGVRATKPQNSVATDPNLKMPDFRGGTRIPAGVRDVKKQQPGKFDPEIKPDRELPAPASKGNERRFEPVQQLPHRGSFIGHTARLAGRQEPKSVSWQDRATGERKFGKVMTNPANKDMVVWDGNKWISKAEWDSKAGRGKLGK